MENGERKTGDAPLPWYAVFRVPLGQLLIIGTLLLSLMGMYFKVQLHAEEIATLKATTVTKDEAADIKSRLDRIENKLDRALENQKGR